MAMAALAGVLMVSAAPAAFTFDPDEWKSVPLGSLVNAATGNGWYFCPDAAENPRILMKATGGNANTAQGWLEGGPPAWTQLDAPAITGINKQGVFIPRALGGGGFLVAPHVGTAAQDGIKVAVFDASGSYTLETADPLTGTYAGVSADLDADDSTLHVGYIDGGNTPCYAVRTGSTWEVALTNPIPNSVLHDTAVVRHGNQTLLYYTATSQGVTTLWRAIPTRAADNKLYVFLAASPLTPLENFVAASLGGGRGGSTGRVYYFGRENGQSTDYKFKRRAGITLAYPTDDGDQLEAGLGNIVPGNVRVGFGNDNIQRVVWYNTATKSIHYYRPTAPMVDALVAAGTPIKLTGNLANPDILGLHFGPDGMPYILYKTNNATAFVAFPNDTYDFNGNGRLDLLDTAFNSNSKGLEVLPVVPAADGVANSANRLKVRFQTIGTAASNGLGAVTTANRALKYSLEVSTDNISWTPITTGAGVTYTMTESVGNADKQIRTFVGVLPGAEPTTNSIRFARMSVTRTPYPY